MKPWVKSWRPRQGSRFEARVSAPARMLFRGLLVYLDDDGLLELPKGSHPHTALGMALGYTSNERRALKGHLGELVKHGCVCVEQDEDGFWSLRAAEWTRFQGRGDASTPRPPDAQSAPTSRPPHHNSTPSPRPPRAQSAPTSRPPHHTGAAKCPESHDREKQEKTEERDREEEEREELTPLRGGGDPPTAPVLVVVESKPKPPKRKRTKVPISREAWTAYAEAYEARYRTEPVRNARVSSQMASFVRCVGADEAPAVAKFYVEHNARWYVTKGHPVGALLNDAEKLRTEWATCRRITPGDAREAERADEVRAQSERVSLKLKQLGVEDR